MPRNTAPLSGAPRAPLEREEHLAPEWAPFFVPGFAPEALPECTDGVGGMPWSARSGSPPCRSELAREQTPLQRHSRAKIRHPLSWKNRATLRSVAGWEIRSRVWDFADKVRSYNALPRHQASVGADFVRDGSRAGVDRGRSPLLRECGTAFVGRITRSVIRRLTFASGPLGCIGV